MSAFLLSCTEKSYSFQELNFKEKNIPFKVTYDFHKFNLLKGTNTTTSPYFTYYFDGSKRLRIDHEDERIYIEDAVAYSCRAKENKWTCKKMGNGDATILGNMSQDP